MKRLDNLITNLEAFQEKLNETIAAIAEENSDFISDLIREGQLFGEGIRGSDGVFLADEHPYATLTVILKTQKGQPTDRVTLRDTGDFHRSLKVKADTQEMEVTASDWKTDKLKAKYGDGILALSDENLDFLKNEIIKPELVKALEKAFDV